MIDTHCHILPNVDDGSDSLQTSMLMAAMAADDGVTGIIATPHVIWDRDYNPEQLSYINKAADSFRKSLKESGLPIVCYLGAEVLCAESVPSLLEEGIFPKIEDTDYALVEFYFDEPAEKIGRCIEEIRSVGIKPILAHPERYYEVQKQKAFLNDLVELGCYLQVNKGSFFGQFGKKAQKTAEWIAKNRLAALLATDAHGVGSRTTRVAAAIESLSQKYGAEYIRLITKENPALLLKNRDMHVR